jgi:hypothetical protein
VKINKEIALRAPEPAGGFRFNFSIFFMFLIVLIIVLGFSLQGYQTNIFP